MFYLGFLVVSVVLFFFLLVFLLCGEKMGSTADPSRCRGSTEQEETV